MSRAGTPAYSALEIGGSLGPYRLEGVLGEGAMGRVFRAVREPSGDVVALKVLRDELAGDDVFLRRFRREGEVARALRHKHLIPVLDAGHADGRYYLASRYVAGPSLAERISSDGPLPVQDVVTIGAQIGAGLDALHRRRLVHRDVKPSNVMLAGPGGAALTDFGVAKGAAHSSLTKSGRVVGTVDYLAPEVIRGEPASPASDLYALGCLLFECLTGSPPFRRKSDARTCIAHVQERPPDPARAREDVTRDFAWALLEALVKDPARRPGTGAAYTRMMRISTLRP